MPQNLAKYTPPMEEVLPEWILNLARKAKDKIVDSFTPPEDVQQTVDFTKQLIAQNQPPLPGFFDKLPRPGQLVSNLLLDTAKDATTPGGAALNVVPELKGASAAGAMAWGAGRRIRNLPPKTLASEVERFMGEIPDAFRDSAKYYADNPELSQIMARTRVLEAPGGTAAVGGWLTAPPNQQGQLGIIGLHPSMVEQDIGKFNRDYVLGHELRHGQQAMDAGRQSVGFGRPTIDATEFDRTYTDLKSRYGYVHHPQEIDARAAGLEGANTRFWADRSTTDQPLLPGVVDKEGIRAWSEGQAVPYRFGDFTIVGADAPLTEFRLRGGPILDNPDAEAMRRVLRDREIGGRSPAFQRPLPMDIKHPAGREFTAVPDTPPSERPFFPDKTYPDKIPGKEPKYAGKAHLSTHKGPRLFTEGSTELDRQRFRAAERKRASDARIQAEREAGAGARPNLAALANDGGNVVEANELGSLYGIDTKRSRARLYLRLGGKDPAVIVARPQRSGDFTYEINPVDSSVMEALLQHSQKLTKR